MPTQVPTIVFEVLDDPDDEEEPDDEDDPVDDEFVVDEPDELEELEEPVGAEPDEEEPVEEEPDEEDAGDEEPEFEGSEHPAHTNNIAIINIATTVNIFFIENSSLKYVITQY